MKAEHEETLQANWFQSLLKKELNGFIDGYEGKKRELPPQCLDQAFFKHFNRNLWTFIKNTITFQNWNKLEFLNQLLMVIATQLSELMTECNDGKIVIDLFTVM